MTVKTPETGPCARCGKVFSEHPAGYCPDGVVLGQVKPDAPMHEPIYDERIAKENT